MHNSQVVQSGECERIVITAMVNGRERTFDLGSPNSRLFPLRVWLYKKKRGI